MTKEKSDKDRKSTKEYQEGEQAFVNGILDSQSPYSLGTNEYGLWIHGWITARTNHNVGHILDKYGLERL